MKATLGIFLIITWSTLAAASAGASSATPPPGFLNLWNGKNLEGWWGAGTENLLETLALSPEALKAKQSASLDDLSKHWSVRGDELVSDGEGLFLTTQKNFGNFELLADYKTVPQADSGIYLRGFPQVQIWDTTDKEKFSLGANKGSGGLWNNIINSNGKYPLAKADKPFGEWNHLRVVMIGSRVWVWLNDQITVNGSILENHFDRNLPIPPMGPIQLQTHGGEICWKNLFIREISNGEAIHTLRGSDPEGFKSVFNGKDLAGWAGPLDCCVVKGSNIIWLKGKSGTIYTEEEFKNFVVRIEFKLPPGGNNGLAIRYPGSGNPAYDAMCELQVLDDHYEKATGNQIDPRQAHGSAYGMSPALRGYHHLIDEWNYQEVTVIGSTIKVELNGTLILNTDLSKVTEFMGSSPHPGKNLTSGHFGIAGHDDPVAFRNISIKSIP